MTDVTGEDHSQEGQDFGAAATASRLITHKCSETRSLDLTNNGMGNHYLKDVDHGSHCLARHRTASLTYMSDETCEGAQVQGYM